MQTVDPVLAGPEWLNADEHSGGGLWPLGLEATGFRMINRLMPGITNTTRRPRYYAFFSWALWSHARFIADGGIDQHVWRDRLEMLMRYATEAYEPGYVGLVGRRRIPPLPKDPGAPVSLRVPGITTAFQAAFYSSSFAFLGCAEAVRTNGWSELSAGVGARLGEAFHLDFLAGVQSEEAREWILSDHDEVPRWVIDEAAEAIALRQVGPSDREQPLLAELLAPTHDRTHSDYSRMGDIRARSMALLLDVAQQADGALPSGWALHRVFATGRLPDGRLLRIDDPFRWEVAGWQRYQERQFEKVALYGFWSAVVHLLTHGTLGTRRLAAAVSGMVEEGDRDGWLERGLETSVADARTAVLLAADTDPVGPGATMSDLAEVVMAKEADPAERAWSALALLLTVAAQWERTAPSVPTSLRGFHDDGGATRWALSYVARQLKTREGRTVRELVDWLVGTAVLGQANRVAVEKLVQQGAYHFFITQGEDGYRLRKPMKSTDYVVYDMPRIESAYSLLEGVSLIEHDEYGIRVTPHGLDTLERVREHAASHPRA